MERKAFVNPYMQPIILYKLYIHNYNIACGTSYHVATFVYMYWDILLYRVWLLIFSHASSYDFMPMHVVHNIFLCKFILVSHTCNWSPYKCHTIYTQCVASKFSCFSYACTCTPKFFNFCVQVPRCISIECSLSIHSSSLVSVNLIRSILTTQFRSFPITIKHNIIL